MSEHAFSFGCDGDALVAILHLPRASSPVGVVVIVGGPQYRAGSHRQFVRLGRALSAAGYPVLRFDARGMGDGTGEPRDFEKLGRDIGAAVDTLIQHAPGVREIVLWGLCDGASAALLYLDETGDARIAGAVLLNPWIRTPASQASTRLRHYYLRRLVAADFWAKLLKGEVAAGEALTEVGGAVRAARHSGTGSSVAYPSRMARGWKAFAGPRLLLLSELDYTAREFETYVDQDAAWRAALATREGRRVPIAGADHTCSQPAAAETVERETIAWLQVCCAQKAPA